MEYSRFEALLAAHGITVYQVSKGTGIAPSTFSDWKRGRSSPKADKLARIADFFSITVDELLGTPSAARESEASYSALRAARMLPVVRELRVGRPIVTPENTVAQEFADVDDPAAHFYYEVQDESMRDSGLLPGARVLCRRQTYAFDGQVALCLIDNRFLLRRYNRKSRVITFYADHPHVPPIKLAPEDFESGRVRILAVAVEAIIKL